MDDLLEFAECLALALAAQPPPVAKRSATVRQCSLCQGWFRGAKEICDNCRPTRKRKQPSNAARGKR